ncbi:CgeB family protein [Dongia deserti]|uniref:CgeB family protein n=1 Tax=Dongia deserti TaxID=2268030 RepID=UPI000E6504F9|nr:glycosyltransferase [Dongia deserti]
MHIAFFGSSLVSSYWNGAATYYRGLLRALADRGHRITFFEPDAFDRQAHRDMPDPSWCKVEVYQPNTLACERMLRQARVADLVVKASGVGVLDEFLEQAVLELQRPNRLVAFCDVDAPATLERVTNDPADPFRSLIPRYDAIFTYGGGDPVVRAYRAMGARLCRPIYNALDPATHFPVAPDPKFAADLSFLGNRLPDREQRVRDFFLQPAAHLPNLTFLLGGAGWPGSHLPANVRTIGHVGTGDHNAFNCSAKAVLNIARDSMARSGFSPATRVFEAAGAGACTITDAWEGIEEFFIPDEEILVAPDGDAVCSILEGLDAERAARIGAAARRAALHRHTYAIRAVAVEETLEGQKIGSVAG